MPAQRQAQNDRGRRKITRPLSAKFKAKFKAEFRANEVQQTLLFHAGGVSGGDSGAGASGGGDAGGAAFFLRGVRFRGFNFAAPARMTARTEFARANRSEH